ncbi:MAG TPA: metal ABC transporter permease [Anaerovoracaceae bacterium]|nr:metal ABC transporter permease [Anaerovoracaceae bacterium]
MIMALFNYTFMQNALIAAILASIVTGIIGTIAIEKKLISMSGGIAHASFGGIGLGYLLGFEPIWGGLAFAIGSSAVISKSSNNKKISADTLIGILWSFGMALGIFFISLKPGYMPDMTSYLFGDILSISNSAIILMSIFTLIILFVFIIMYNYWIIYLLDEEFAKAKKINICLIKFIVYLLLPIGIIVLTRVVGIILTIALMTIPTSMAKLFFNSFSKVVISSIFISMFFCVSGLIISYYINIPSGVCIIIIMTIVYLTVFFLKKTVQYRLHEKKVHGN